MVWAMVWGMMLVACSDCAGGRGRRGVAALPCCVTTQAHTCVFVCALGGGGAGCMRCAARCARLPGIHFAHPPPVTLFPAARSTVSSAPVRQLSAAVSTVASPQVAADVQRIFDEAMQAARAQADQILSQVPKIHPTHPPIHPFTLPIQPSTHSHTQAAPSALAPVLTPHHPPCAWPLVALTPPGSGGGGKDDKGRAGCGRRGQGSHQGQRGGWRGFYPGTTGPNPRCPANPRVCSRRRCCCRRCRLLPKGCSRRGWVPL
jgi:hypothetical protein